MQSILTLVFRLEVVVEHTSFRFPAETSDMQVSHLFTMHTSRYTHDEYTFLLEKNMLKKHVNAFVVLPSLFFLSLLRY